MTYLIGEIAQKTGLSVHTLRYYEKEGLLPFVQKNKSGLRIYTDKDIGWISLINCLKSTGMPLKGIKQYIDWFLMGNSTLEQRLNMFKQQKTHIQEQLKQMHRHLDKINYKITLYEEAVQLGSLNKAHAKLSQQIEENQIKPDTP